MKPTLCLLLCFLSLTAGALAAAGERVEGLVLPFQEVTLSAAVNGLVASVNVEEGESVVSGQILAQLADAEARLEVERSAKVVELKRFDAEGTEKLLEREMVRRDEAMEKQVELRIAELQSELAEVALERRRIRAPFSGVVVARGKEPGEWAEPGAAFFKLIAFDQVYLQLLLPHSVASRLEIGQALEIESSRESEELGATGAIAFIDPRVDAGSGFQRVKLLLDNPDRRILPGARLWARLPEGFSQ